MKKIFNKKNLKKVLTYTAVAIGGAVLGSVVYNKVIGKEVEQIEETEFNNNEEEIIDVETEA